MDKPLRWSAAGHGWFGAKDDGTVIFVEEETYQRRLRACLAAQGIELKTWTQYIRPAEEAWARQCEAEKRFRACLDQWLTCREPGSRITFPQPERIE